jgi:DNA-binding response OmpR family regulator
VAGSPKKFKSVICIGTDPIQLNLCCSVLREHGWNVLSSGSGFDGILQFGTGASDVVVLDTDGDGSEAALIAAEMKRLRPDVPIILTVRDVKALVEGAAQSADSVVPRTKTCVEVVAALENLH